MKYSIYIVLFIFFNQSTDKEKIKEFSNNLVKIISQESICELSKVKVFPKENTITLRTLDYILGNDHQAGFVKLFQNKNIVTKIYGPYDEDNEEYYYLIYYDPNKVKRNEKGNLDPETIRENWGKNYIETLVTVIDSEVYFYYTPFFFETDTTW